jgi:cytochrome P450
MSRAELPSGPKGFPLIGSALQFKRDPLAFVTRCFREYGDVVRVSLGYGNMYLLFHPEHIDHVLHRSQHNFIKGAAFQLRLSFLGNGLLTSNGEPWRIQRNMTQPVFQHKQIAGYGELMVRCALEEISTWEPGQLRDVHADLQRLTLRIITKTVLDCDLQDETIERIGCLMSVMAGYLEDLLSTTQIMRRLPTPSALRFKRSVRELEQIVYAIIQQRRRNGCDRQDLLSRLLTTRDGDGTPLTPQAIRDQIITLILAGHETTAVLLSFCFHLLSQHPRTEAKVVSELAEVLGDRLPTVADIPRLQYANRVIQETMRLYPPVWATAREAVEDCEIGGYAVPKGTQLVPCLWVVHRDRRWFDQPEAFRPERWGDDLAKRLPRCAFLPFGEGPRTCIGNHFAMAETVLVLTTILRQYHLLPIPGQTLRLQPTVTLRPKGGMRMMVAACPQSGSDQDAR